MSPQTIELLGYLAGGLTTISLFPQVLKTWKTKSAGDLSLGTLVVFSIGMALWFTYGLLVHSGPMIVSNSASLAESSFLVVMKMRDDAKKPRSSRTS